MSATTERQASEIQTKVLQALGNWRGGLARPSVIAEQVGMANEASVRYNLKQLEIKGYIRRVTQGQGLQYIYPLTEKGRAAIGLPPRALQSDTGGVMLLAEQQIALNDPRPLFVSGGHAGEFNVELEAEVRYIALLSDLFPVRDGEYFLPIRGECMDGGNEPVKRGDVCLFKPASRINRPENGEIAHVEVAIEGAGQSAALVRRYFFDEEAGLVTLGCYNPAPDEPAQLVLPDKDVDPRGVLLYVIHCTRGAKASAVPAVHSNGRGK